MNGAMAYERYLLARSQGVATSKRRRLPTAMVKDCRSPWPWRHLIDPFGEESMPMTIDCQPTTQQQPSVIDLARCVEPDTSLLTDWWNGTAIAELGNMTPRELVLTGKCGDLERFLRSILGGDRE
jgi:hypothetical protein